MNITCLEKCFKAATDLDVKFIAVKILMDGQEKPEVIINQRQNFESKLAYYTKAYNEDLTLKTYGGIRIVGFAFGNSFNEIQVKLNEWVW